jgi:hypothetical protein
MGTGADAAPRVEDHGGVAVGRVGAEGWVPDFAGVRIGRVLEDGVVEDFAGVDIGAVTGSRRATARGRAVR